MLAPADLQELTRKLRHNEHPVWRSTPDIAHTFSELAACVQQAPHRLDVSRLIIHTNHLLLSLLEALRHQCRAEDARLVSRRRTVELFLENLPRNSAVAAQPWTLPALAAECGLGTTAFALYCRQITNQSPTGYLNRCRLDHAVTQLRAKPVQPITAIALDCGFASSQYFATCFRQRFGHAPSVHRHAPA